jgi:hypothetical protein
MSFIDSATEALDRTEASLDSILMDALKAKAYSEVATIAALANALAAILRSHDGRTPASTDLNVGPTALAAAEPTTTRPAEPSWMRPSTR